MSAESSGQRLDKYVAEQLRTPRNRVQRWIREGLVTVDGDATRASATLDVGAQVEIDRPEHVSGDCDTSLAGEAGDLQVLAQDDDLIIVDKPAGIAVHPGAGRSQGTLAHRLLHRYPEVALVGSPARPGIVHRLDLGTTGVMAVARNQQAYERLCAAFEQRRVRKRYLAIVYGEPRRTHGSVELAIGRHSTQRTRMTTRADGRPARTDYRCLESVRGLSVMQLELHTGRTHQARVHMQAIGHPLVGDAVYGDRRWRLFPTHERSLLRDFARPALHAWHLELEHPVKGVPRLFSAPIAADMDELWLRWAGSTLTSLAERSTKDQYDR